MVVNKFPLIDTFVQHRTEMGRIMHHNDAVLGRMLVHGIRIQFLLMARCLHLVVITRRSR
ncbi:hypothetical protein D5F51_05095 [Yersinia hibernica]|uniref:Uncharacterized protein n=2 Tax=Yersinia TaxID=629 RepID=A0ABX5QY16_9GAMM|nr:hypothetical protein LC20_08280 [Yersinia hibernica]QAX77976.1 hypothetical protein D5F51_05095 [Yersinia hibernica]